MKNNFSAYKSNKVQTLCKIRFEWYSQSFDVLECSFCKLILSVFPPFSTVKIFSNSTPPSWLGL